MVFKRGGGGGEGGRSLAIERRCDSISRTKAVSGDRMGYKQFKAWEEASAGWVFIYGPICWLSNPLGESKPEWEKYSG